MIKKVALFAFIVLIIVLALAPLVSLLRGEPSIAVAVRSWSMEPVLTRGDMVFIRPTGENYDYKTGQVIVFQPEKQQDNAWIMHRIVGGNTESGFITRGDASNETDQDRDYTPVQPEQIAGIAMFLGDHILKIPYLGNLMLFFSEDMDNPFLFTVFLSILALLIIWTPKNKSRDSN